MIVKAECPRSERGVRKVCPKEHKSKSKVSKVQWAIPPDTKT
jgi:hypothetical protein